MPHSHTDKRPRSAAVEAELVGLFCSLGGDCICKSVHGAPDPICNHYRKAHHVPDPDTLPPHEIPQPCYAGSREA
jgi:hypothetical protein